MMDPTQHYRARHVAPPLHGLKLGLAALLLSLVLPTVFVILFSLTIVNQSNEDIDIGWLFPWVLVGYFGIAPAIILAVFAVRKNRIAGKIMGILALLVALAVIGYHVFSVFVGEGYVSL